MNTRKRRSASKAKKPGSEPSGGAGVLGSAMQRAFLILVKIGVLFGPCNATSAGMVAQGGVIAKQGPNSNLWQNNARPKKKKATQKKLNADRSCNATSAGMVAQGGVIAKQGPNSTLWQNNATIQQSGQDAINACAQLGKDETDVSQLEVQLDAARTKRDGDRVAAASKLDIFFTNAEDVAKTPKDLQDLGITHLTGHTYVLSGPLSLSASVDPNTRMISARVKCAPGMKRSSIEIAGDQAMTAGVKVFPGDGARQTMGPFAPGTYYLHACHIRASERSAYTETITVVVK